MSRQGSRKVRKKPEVNGLPIDQIEGFQTAFELFDGTTDGRIKPVEILQTMKDVGLENKHPAIFGFIESIVIKYANQAIDFDTFINEINLRFKDYNTEEGIKHNFELFTNPGEDYIDVYSLKKLAKDLGGDDEELMQLLKEVENSGEKITYEEFTQILSSYNNNK